MVLEAILIMVLLLLLSKVALSLPVQIGLIVAVAGLCLPALRLAIRQAPPFVPTSRRMVDRMVALAGIQPGEHVVDLGCGDGRFLRAAAAKGARATGYELSVPALLLARLRTRGCRDVRVRYGDLWKQDLRDADVVVCYLLLAPMRRFEEQIWPTLKPGCRVISHIFPMPTVVPAEKRDGAVLYVK